MSASPHPSANELFTDCPLVDVAEGDYPSWTNISHHAGPSTARTLQWLYRVIKTVETNCNNLAYVASFKKLPTSIGKAIASNRISVASSPLYLRKVYTIIRSYGDAAYGDAEGTENPYVMEQQFAQACMAQAIVSKIANGSPLIKRKEEAGYSDEERLSIWLAWDIANASRQMQDIGNASRPLDLPASTKERKQRLNCDPVTICESICDQMTTQLAQWKDEYGGGYIVIRNMFGEFMKTKVKRSRLDALVAGQPPHARNFGAYPYNDVTSVRSQKKIRRKKLNKFEETYKCPCDSAVQANYDEKNYDTRLREARRFVARTNGKD